MWRQAAKNKPLTILRCYRGIHDNKFCLISNNLERNASFLVPAGTVSTKLQLMCQFGKIVMVKCLLIVHLVR